MHGFVLAAAAAVVAGAAAGCRHGAAPASAPSCATVAAKVYGLITTKDQRATDVRDVVLAACVRDPWSDEMRRCIVGTKSLDEPRHCKAKLTVEARARFEAALAEVEERARARDVPKACDQWAKQVARLQSCDALPRGSRDALVTSYEIQRRSLAELDPAAAEEQCRQGVEIINQIASDLCGWVMP